MTSQSERHDDLVLDDPLAFRQIVQKHQGRVFRVALTMTGNRAEAEDITQDAFLRAYRAHSSFRGDASVGTWIYRIAVNLSLDVLSARQRDRRSTPTEVQSDHDESRETLRSEDDPERRAESTLLGEDIRRALNGLTPRERAVFVLRHYEDLPLKEVASTLSIRVGTVKSLLFRAVLKLQKDLSVYREEADR